MPMTISLITAGACALINLWLSFRIGQLRRAHAIYVGDGGNEAVARRMRAQANFVENAPFVLILTALIEYSWGPSLWLWIAAGAFVLARLAHARGMDGWLPGRMGGTLVTMVVLLGLAIAAIALPLITHHAIPASGVVSPPPAA